MKTHKPIVLSLLVAMLLFLGPLYDRAAGGTAQQCSYPRALS